jgi:hypothetical protein
VQRRLNRTGLLIRAGPAVGLMGTLIPLAPGLAGGRVVSRIGLGRHDRIADNAGDPFASEQWAEGRGKGTPVGAPPTGSPTGRVVIVSPGGSARSAP